MWNFGCRMISRMKRILVIAGFAAALASCDRSDAADSPAPAKSGGSVAAFEDVDMLQFGDFLYVDRMELPEHVKRLHGKNIRVVGFMNPGRQVKKIKEFELVMNRDSCCYGARPKMNHFFQTILKDSETVFTSDPVTVMGRFEVDEQWDGDWQLGLYWLKDARVVK